jgi:hypothetical protein
MNAFCSGCGKGIANDQILYTADARIVCPQCNASTEVAVANWNVGNKIKGAAITSAACGALCFVFDPVFITTIVAISSGIYGLTSVGRDTDQQFQVDKSKGMILGLSILGLVLALAKVVLLLMVLAK